MSDSYGSFDRARFQAIKAEYGEGIARLSFDVFDSPGSPDNLLILPKMHGHGRPEIPEHLQTIKAHGVGVSLPSGSSTPTKRLSNEHLAYQEEKSAYQAEKARYRAAKRR